MQTGHDEDKYKAEMLTLYSNLPKQTHSQTAQTEDQVK